MRNLGWWFSLLASALLTFSAHAVQLDGPDFLVGTWTRDGDCMEGDVIKHVGDVFHSTIRGRRYVGNVQRDGAIIKASFTNDDGESRRYTYEIESDNRVRVIDLTTCDAVHCEEMHVQSFFFFMRCSE